MIVVYDDYTLITCDVNDFDGYDVCAYMLVPFCTHVFTIFRNQATQTLVLYV